MSLPARGAWIEIARHRHRRLTRPRRSPQGERGLKCQADGEEDDEHGRSPQGERGLKYLVDLPGFDTSQVAPRKGSVD